MSGHMQGGSKMDAWAAPLFILQVGVSSQPPSRSVHLTGPGAEHASSDENSSDISFLILLFCCSCDGLRPGIARSWDRSIVQII